MRMNGSFLHSLHGRGIYEALVHTLYNQCPEFPEEYKRYSEAVGQLREGLGTETVPSVDMFVTAIEMQCCSDMLFAGFQGIKMNYDNFLDPMRPNITWAQVDYEQAWREELADGLPMYRAAQRVIDDFRALMTQEQRTAVREYICSLRSSGPKLAHYYGYLMGNTLLRDTVPGYHGDPVLEQRYCRLLEGFFGCRLDRSQWEGCYTPGWRFAPIERTDAQKDLVLREMVYRYRGRESAAG